MIAFDKFVTKAEFHNPLKGFELDSQMIEHRVDPLTGFTSVVRTGRKEWAWTYITDEELLHKIIENSRGRCFFCPEKVSTSTPKFPADLMPEGRLHIGEACLFPNLFAQKEYSAIVVISKSHYLKTNEFTPEILLNGLKASLIYIRRVYEAKSTRFAEIGCNYLAPAGASLPHPHLQVLASARPYYFIKVLLMHSEEYYKEHSANYWEELIETEQREGERYLGCIGNTEWYTPFAPTREDEVHALVKNKSNFLEFEENELEDLAEGISRVLRYYGDKGLASFNFTLYSAPLGEKPEYFWAGLMIVSRPGVQTCYPNDIWFSANLHLDGFITEPPEEVAGSLRGYF
jgi:galactose-1-phosphate uridylyltransferase